MLPGIRYFFDSDRKVSELYGAVDADAEGESGTAFKPFTLVLDPFLRVIGVFTLDDPAKHNSLLDRLLGSLPPVDGHASTEICAPVLILPRVFEPQFCKELIGLYERRGGTEPAKGGFFRAHRDNTTKGTAYRRFACTVNLNASTKRAAISAFPNSARAPIERRPGAPSCSPARCCRRRRR